jgi:nucleoside diphosphate kinase
MTNVNNNTNTNNNMKNLAIILAKPIAVRSGRENKVVDFVLEHGDIVSMKKVIVSSWQISQHYKQFAGKKFFMDLVNYYTGQEVVVIAARIDIPAARAAIGDSSVDAGSFRDELIGDMFAENLAATGVKDNGIHCSDSPEEGQREHSVWFGKMPINTPYEGEKLTQAQQVHDALWSKFEDLGLNFTFAGGTQNGTAIESKPVDLDYRVFADNVFEAAKMMRKAMPELILDKYGYDAKLGAGYIKFEVEFEHGKADVAIVPVDSYRYKVSKAHLMDLLDEEDKALIRRLKAEAYPKGKTAYEAAKAEIREMVLAKFSSK